MIATQQTNHTHTQDVNRAVLQFGLDSASPGQLAIALARRLECNTEIKIKNGKIRVQHSEHIDNLRCEYDIDHALAANDLFGT